MPDFKYTLTRQCLRTGRLSLPYSMLAFVPEGGTWQVMDSERNETFEAQFSAPRTLEGLSDYFSRHNLAVNDTLVLELLGEDMLVVTAQPRTRRASQMPKLGGKQALDDILAQATPLSEAEMRALHPVLKDADLSRLLGDDTRFALKDGRWHNAARLRSKALESDVRSVPIKSSPADGLVAETWASAPRTVEARPAESRATAPRLMDSRRLDFQHPKSQHPESQHPDSQHPESQHPESQVTETRVTESRVSASRTPDTRTPDTRPPETGPSASRIGIHQAPERWPADNRVTELRAEPPRSGQPEQLERPARASRNNNRKGRASVTPYPRGVIFPSDVGLNSEQAASDLTQQQRLKEVLTRLGFRVEGMAHGQLLARAEMNRRHYSVLILNAESNKVDFAALAARRRDAGATYAAVFGHEQDLAPLSRPAEQARVSLWSHRALSRLEQLLDLVPLSPVDLEPHFAQDGLYEAGLERFERTIEGRVEERGVFSAVLTRLAAMRAPTIFMLDDVSDPTLSREQVLKVLELLAQAPFHLVSKVDSGEFCLRFKVADGLLKLSDYALSLRERLPTRRTERLMGAAAGPDSSND